MTLTVSAPFCREPILVGLRPPHSHKRTNGATAKRRTLASDPARDVAKRVIDIIGAGLALLFFAPLFVAIAIAIKAGSPGPVFFRQRRYGQRNRLLRIYKFRTMYAHLD